MWNMYLYTIGTVGVVFHMLLLLSLTWKERPLQPSQTCTHTSAHTSAQAHRHTDTHKHRKTPYQPWTQQVLRQTIVGIMSDPNLPGLIPPGPVSEPALPETCIPVTSPHVTNQLRSLPATCWPWFCLPPFCPVLPRSPANAKEQQPHSYQWRERENDWLRGRE